MSTKAPLRFPSSTNPYGKKSDNSRDLTSERIAHDMQAFQAAGGTVELLGITPLFKRGADAKPGATKR